MPDSDRSIAAGFEALREQYADPGLPPEVVIEAVHRRRRRAQAVSVAAAAVAVAAVAILIPLLASASGSNDRPAVNHPSPTASRPAAGLRALLTLPAGPVTQPISIDGGRLRIDPAPNGYRPRVPASLATGIVKRIGKYGPRPPQPAYGRVTIAPSLTGALPGYQSRSAWISVIQPSPDTATCPAPISTAPPGTPNSLVVILTDANTGHASILYQSKGVTGCGDLRRPEVFIAQETIGLSWTMLGQRADPTQPGSVDWHIAYRAPACALTRTTPGLTSNNSGQPILYVETQMPIDRPANCPTTETTTWFGPERHNAHSVRHALTGRHYY